LSQVRVKRKGQVTIPIELRSQLGIKEGALLEAKEEEGTIVLRPTPRIKGGRVVGEKEHKQVIRELDRLRMDWR
jgi:AbrB family looped-hinge helix DNA binding protein